MGFRAIRAGGFLLVEAALEVLKPWPARTSAAVAPSMTLKS